MSAWAEPDRSVRVGARAPATGLRLLWRRMAFGAYHRAEAWQLIADVLEGSGADLGEMMEAVAQGYALQGRRSVAGVLLEIRAGLGDARLTARLRPYCGTSERILFEGLGAQAPAPVFASAARLLRSQMAMRKAIWGAVALPLLLLAGFMGLLLFFGLTLLPALEEVIPLETLTGLQSLNLKFYFAYQCLASLRVRRRILATSAQAVELSIVRSQSLANRRHLPSHAKVRSTTHRLGSRTKPFALSGRLTVSSVHSSPMACRSLSPAYPPSAKIWRKHGNFLPAALSRSGAPSRSWMLAA